MAITPTPKSRPFLFFFIFLFLAIATHDLVLASEDPELPQCIEKCQHQKSFSKKQKEECASICKEYIRRKHGDDNTNDFLWENPKSPTEKLRECRQRCDTKTYAQQSDCRDKCWEDYTRQEQEHEKAHTKDPQQRYKEENNPYLFQDQHFQTKFETEHGRVRILQNFAERSKLLQGLINHRVAILEANPSTFIAPVHYDAESLFFLAEGKATISLIRQDKRESFNLNTGDIIRIPSGTTLYMINRSKNKKLVVIKLLQPVSTPGHFEAFFGPGGKNPESFFNVFSPELLESVFKVKKEKIQRVFGKQSQGVIVKASEQQIKAMSQHEAGGIWPFGGGSKGSFNLFEKLRTSQSNQYGKLYEIAANDNKDLTELNVGVSYVNITKGSMTAPFYNSKATNIVFVIRGEGCFEMASPQQQQQQKSEQRGTRYERVSGKLRKGVVYVVPAGHPVITVSDGSQNLELLKLEVNGLDNEKFRLAGQKNIISQIEKTALELSFGGIQEEEVREVFESQPEEVFFKGPNSPQQQQEGHGFAASA